MGRGIIALGCIMQEHPGIVSVKGKDTLLQGHSVARTGMYLDILRRDCNSRLCDSPISAVDLIKNPTPRSAYLP